MEIARDCFSSFPRMTLTCASTRNASSSRVSVSRLLYSTVSKPKQTDDCELVCDVDAEPLHRYRPGGYHPIRIGDTLKDGRYQVLHKLGWGGYSTVWAARDLRVHKCVAMKISASERGEQSREAKVIRAMKATKSDGLNLLHIISMMDHFQLQGPNGVHDCFVLEMTGPSVPSVLEKRFRDERLPGRLAKSIAKQALIGLDCLYQQGIAHGDLHTQNLVFTVSSMHSLSKEECLQKLKKAETGVVRRKDGKLLGPGVPGYLVRPTRCSVDLSSPPPLIKIVDFGESFLAVNAPNELHTPLVVREPEVVFKDTLDYRVDLWSMGCMLFELVTGQPPFDSIMMTPSSLIRQMLDTTGKELPERWQSAWHAMKSSETREASVQTLQAWLEDLCFDEEKEVDLTREEIVKVGEVVRRMLRLEPMARASARVILQDPWFQSE